MKSFQFAINAFCKYQCFLFRFSVSSYKDEDLKCWILLSISGLEIHEIPLKSPPLDFGKLSISDASPIIVHELKITKILVGHAEAVNSRLFVPNPSHDLKSKEKNEEGRRKLRLKVCFLISLSLLHTA
ncbi:RNA-directed DNA methylation 4-like [Sesamum indicum]|uniref:RNA-directed DNA methylation 4-like n=1 Tax=Sesamum indicum TaxID=4182 RepID=A0A8M8UTE6_SESIN|nr:RNA-directed DNA methylation 4-like [Sesamum indicum]